MGTHNGTSKGKHLPLVDSVFAYLLFVGTRKATVTQETLKTQIDNLQWEVNHLDAENMKLRDCSPEKSGFVDLENELNYH